MIHSLYKAITFTKDTKVKSSVLFFLVFEVKSRLTIANNHQSLLIMSLINQFLNYFVNEMIKRSKNNSHHNSPKVVTLNLRDHKNQKY